jgi:hypothetical protein
MLRAVVVVAIVSPVCAWAQQPLEPQSNRYLGDRFSLRVFAGLTELNTDVAAGRGLGALINLEKILGFDNEINSWSMDGFWRISRNRRHALRFQYYDFSRDAYRAVQGSVPIFDVEFVGDVSSRFGNEVGTLAYQYSLINHHKTEAGITAGIGFYRYSLSLEGRFIVDGDPNLSEFGSRSEAILAPVPNVGFYINQALRHNLVLDIRASFVDLAIGAHEGRIFNTVANLTWYLSRHFGIGLGVAGADIVYENTGSDDRIKVELRQTSLNLNFAVVF